MIQTKPLTKGKSRRRLKLMLLLGMKRRVIQYLRYNGIPQSYLN